MDANECGYAPLSVLKSQTKHLYCFEATPLNNDTGCPPAGRDGVGSEKRGVAKTLGLQSLLPHNRRRRPIQIPHTFSFDLLLTLPKADPFTDNPIHFVLIPLPIHFPFTNSPYKFPIHFFFGFLLTSRKAEY